MQCVNGAQQNVQQSVTFTGKVTGSETPLSDRKLPSGVTIPSPAVLWDPTPAEEQAITNALKAVFWRIGDTVTFTAPSIAGYQTPSPATKTFVLGASTNVRTILYTQGSSGSSAGGGTLVNAGLQALVFTVASTALLAMSLFVFRLRDAKNQPESTRIDQRL